MKIKEHKTPQKRQRAKANKDEEYKPSPEELKEYQNLKKNLFLIKKNIANLDSKRYWWAKRGNRRRISFQS